jgi:predicted ArsR family transcriptional regulator
MSDETPNKENELILSHNAAQTVLSLIEIVRVVPRRDQPRRSVAAVAGDLGRPEDYVRQQLERLAEEDVVDITEDGVRLAYRRVVVEPLVKE